MVISPLLWVGNPPPIIKQELDSRKQDGKNKISMVLGIPSCVLIFSLGGLGDFRTCVEAPVTDLTTDPRVFNNHGRDCFTLDNPIFVKGIDG